MHLPVTTPIHGTSVLAEQVKVAHRQLVAPSLDAKGRYLVGAAVGTRQEDRTRVDQLRSQAEVDVVILDSSQGVLSLSPHPCFATLARMDPITPSCTS